MAAELCLAYGCLRKLKELPVALASWSMFWEQGFPCDLRIEPVFRDSLPEPFKGELELNGSSADVIDRLLLMIHKLFA